MRANPRLHAKPFSKLSLHCLAHQRLHAAASIAPASPELCPRGGRRWCWVDRLPAAQPSHRQGLFGIGIRMSLFPQLLSNQALHVGRHRHRVWLSHSLGVSQPIAFETTLWIRHLRLCPLGGHGTLCSFGGVLNPLWANRVCGVLGIKMTLLIGVKNPVGVDIGLDPLIHAGTVGRSR